MPWGWPTPRGLRGRQGVWPPEERIVKRLDSRLLITIHSEITLLVNSNRKHQIRPEGSQPPGGRGSATWRTYHYDPIATFKLLFQDLCSNSKVFQDWYNYATIKNRTLRKLLLQSSLWMKFWKIGEIWKELDQTQRIQPTGIFSDQPFRSYSSLKMTCLKQFIDP
jgi:hypothetical protein